MKKPDVRGNDIFTFQCAFAISPKIEKPHRCVMVNEFKHQSRWRQIDTVDKKNCKTLTVTATL